MYDCYRFTRHQHSSSRTVATTPRLLRPPPNRRQEGLTLSMTRYRRRNREDQPFYRTNRTLIDRQTTVRREDGSSDE
ncbi:hypothetical protein C8039_08715 [Halogeometricum sp. wsp3]|nr:hypothetical protein C8039_08715 [Halogeometricum sp. wsp3]